MARNYFRIQITQYCTYINVYSRISDLIEFEKHLNVQDDLSRKDISEIQNIFDTWHETLSETYVYKDFTDSRRISTPKQTTAYKISESFEDLKRSMASFLQRFGDGDSLILQGTLPKPCQ